MKLLMRSLVAWLFACNILSKHRKEPEFQALFLCVEFGGEGDMEGYFFPPTALAILLMLPIISIGKGKMIVLPFEFVNSAIVPR